VRRALDLPPETPVVSGDVRERPHAVAALVALVEHALRRQGAGSVAA